MKNFFTLCLVLCLGFNLKITSALAQGKTMPGAKTHIMLKAQEMKWMEGPASLPAGAKVATIEGDPAKAGPFTMRAILPPNYTIMPHYHPGIEHITVLEGEFFMGHGDDFDEAKGSKMEVGGFAVMPAKFHHYAYTKKKQAVIQLHGVGPWDIVYLDKANDPRKKK